LPFLGWLVLSRPVASSSLDPRTPSILPALCSLLVTFGPTVSIRTSQLATLVAPTFPLRISTLVSLEHSKAPGEEVERVLDLGPQILREGKWEAAKGDLLESVTDEFLSSESILCSCLLSTHGSKLGGSEH
jgi:hypothetical protein